jgi:putative ABC transport system ATP-binding protein
VQVEVVITLLRQLASEGRTVLVATHDDRMIPLADTVVEMAPRIEQATDAPSRLDVSRGDVIFEQGSHGSLVYVLEAGRVDIVRDLVGGGEEKVATIRPGEYFGELGPMLGLPRSATARAAQRSVLTAYSARDFRHRAGAETRERLRTT